MDIKMDMMNSLEYYRNAGGILMKNDSSTECWSKCWSEVSDEWFLDEQLHAFRNYFIMPFTLKQLGNVSGKMILDIGCGEGGYSRELARKGAIVTAIDCAENVINYSQLKAADEKLKISHYVRNSNDLYGVSDNTFDIVLSSMMLMDCEDFNGTVSEISRVLKSGGKLFVSVLHPCFNGKDVRSQRVNGIREVIIRDYLSPTEWEAPIKALNNSTVIWRHRTLQDYVKVFTKNGLQITDLNEPLPNDEQIAKSPKIGCLSKIPIFLFIELKNKTYG